VLRAQCNNTICDSVHTVCSSRYQCLRRPNTRLSVVQRELGLTLGSPRAAAATMASALVVDDCDSASGSNRRSRRRRSQPARSGRVAKGSKVCSSLMRCKLFSPESCAVLSSM